jgi:hypothetical protein
MVLWFWPDETRNAISTMDFVAAGDNNHSPYRTKKSPDQYEHFRLNPSPSCADLAPALLVAGTMHLAPGTRIRHEEPCIQVRGTKG